MPIDLELMEVQLNTEPSVILDNVIVTRYLRAKKIIDEILRFNEPIKESLQESFSSGCQEWISNSSDEPHNQPIDDVSTQVARKQSTETTLTNNTFKSCGYHTQTSSLSINDKISEKDSPVVYHDNENPEYHAGVQYIEIPFDSNIVVNPLNNRFSFSQIDISMIKKNQLRMLNENASNQYQSDGPKYLYNPMNNIVTSSETNDNLDDYSNNNQPNSMPQDVQFAPGEYTIEDTFLNDNYNIVNAFTLESNDMDCNQNTEKGSKEQDLTMHMDDTVVNTDTTTDDMDLPNCHKIEDPKANFEPLTKKLGSRYCNKMEPQQQVETDFGKNICKKCNKNFKVLYYLKKHELTCGMTFHYNCLFCAKTSLLSHTIKCHMINHHADQVAVYGIKETMEMVIKRRRENKETLNILLSKENQGSSDVEGNFNSLPSFDQSKKIDKRKQSFSKARHDGIVEIKKEALEENFTDTYCTEEDSSNLQSSDVCNNEKSFKASKEYVDAVCSNCNIYFKNLKSGTLKSCHNCQSPLIYICAVCQKCFHKYLSICGHVKYHSKLDLNEISEKIDKYVCGYCTYETIHKNYLLRHILGHVREKAAKVKRQFPV